MAQSPEKPCLQTDKMMIKLSTILKENGGIGSSISRSNGVAKFSSASIHRLHEEFSAKMKNSIRNYTKSAIKADSKTLAVSSNEETCNQKEILESVI